MALTGTLKDFSVTDIFQLIGQQAKSGVLHLRGEKGEEVHISFHQGTVVGAENVSRDKKDLLGRMLVRARLIEEEDLVHALESQKRTLRRLGDILVDEGAISREDLREMTQLQITETLYGLFHWSSGTYAFEAKEVIWDEQSVAPLRSEAVLMDGFRIVDEWPQVRLKISSSKNTFQILKPLPDPPTTTTEVDETSFADLMDEPEDDFTKAERRLMDIIGPGRTVDDLVDLSRLGTFETWKALSTLMEKGYILQLTPSQGGAATAPQGQSALRSLREHGAAIAYAALVLALLVGIFTLGKTATWAEEGALEGSLEVERLERVRFAVEVFRLVHGVSPGSFEEILEAKLLRRSDLRHPLPETLLESGQKTDGWDVSIAPDIGEEEARRGTP